MSPKCDPYFCDKELLTTEKHTGTVWPYVVSATSVWSYVTALFVEEMLLHPSFFQSNNLCLIIYLPVRSRCHCVFLLYNIIHCTWFTAPVAVPASITALPSQNLRPALESASVSVFATHSSTEGIRPWTSHCHGHHTMYSYIPTLTPSEW